MKTTIITPLLALTLIGCGEAPPTVDAPAALTFHATPPTPSFQFTKPPGQGSMSGWWRGELDGQLWTASLPTWKTGPRSVAFAWVSGRRTAPGHSGTSTVRAWAR